MGKISEIRKWSDDLEGMCRLIYYIAHGTMGCCFVSKQMMMMLCSLSLNPGGGKCEGGTQVELQTIHRFSQSRSLLELSPGWNHLLTSAFTFNV